MPTRTQLVSAINALRGRTPTTPIRDTELADMLESWLNYFDNHGEIMPETFQSQLTDILNTYDGHVETFQQNISAVAYQKYLAQSAADRSEVSMERSEAAADRADMGLIAKGAWNAATNTPTLTSIPNSEWLDGSYLDITPASGTLPFAGANFIIGQKVNSGDRLKKIGSQWAYIKDPGKEEVNKLKENLPFNNFSDRYAIPVLDPKDNLYGGFLTSGEWEAIKYLANSINGDALKKDSVRYSSFDGQTKSLMYMPLDSASGFMHGLVDLADNRFFAIRNDGSFEVSKYAPETIEGIALKANSVTGDKLMPGSVDQTKLSAPLLTRLNALTPQSAFIALASAAFRRVDVVMFGDSNQKFGGDGWDGGFNIAMSERFSQYATPMYSARNGISYEGGAMTIGSGSSHTTAGADEGIPSQFTPYLYPSSKGTYYNSDGDFESQSGMINIQVGSPLGINNALRAHIKVLKFPGGGTFRPGWRRESSPFTALATGSIFSFESSQLEEAYHTVDLPNGAGTRNFPVAMKYRLPAGTAAVGPNMILNSRVENPAATAGYSISNLYAAGGQSLWDMAEFLRTSTIQEIGNYFKEVRRLQVLAGQKPVIVVYINSAVNDQNETSTPSQGWRESALPQSATAYIDNLEYMVNRLEQAYQFMGFDVNELTFFIMPSHPVSNPDAAKLISYRKAAQAFASRPRCSFIDITTVVTSNEISSNGWYNQSGGGGDDVNHLLIAGNTEILRRIFNKYLPN